MKKRGATHKKMLISGENNNKKCGESPFLSGGGDLLIAQSLVEGGRKLSNRIR